MNNKEALESLKFEVFEEGHCSYIEQELNIAIEALEKQIPKKLVVWDNGTQHCPYCEHDLTYISSEDEYCCRCGQKIDWRD